MGCAIALPLVAALVQAASLDAELGLRAEGRSTTLDASGLPRATRASMFAIPSVTGLADAWRLRLAATYAPRFWTGDVESHVSPLVNHAVDARLGTHHDATWRAEAAASGIRGMIDPLADPWHAAAAAAGPLQVATTGQLRYEELRTGLLVEAALGLRTTISATAGWQVSRAMEPEARSLLPSQRRASLDAALTRLATERDTLRLEASGRQTVTDATGGQTTTTLSSALASWRRRLSPNVEGWLGGGATLAVSDELEEATAYDVLPRGEAGVARAGDVALGVEIAAHLTTFVDRFTGDVSPMADVMCALRWNAGERIAVAVTTSGGARTDLDTALAVADARMVWTLRERLALEVGVNGRWQHERRPEIPSFVESTAFVGVGYTTERLFGTSAP